MKYTKTPTYQVIQTEIADEDGNIYPTYGIEAVDEKGTPLKRIPDISLSREAVTRLAETMNLHEVALVHFLDVVEDFLDEPL